MSTPTVQGTFPHQLVHDERLAGPSLAMDHDEAKLVRTQGLDGRRGSGLDLEPDGGLVGIDDEMAKSVSSLDSQ